MGLLRSEPEWAMGVARSGGSHKYCGVLHQSLFNGGGSIVSWLQWILDQCYHGRTWLLDSITWISIRTCGFEVPFEAVRNKRYAGEQHVNLNLDAAQDLDLLLAGA